MGIITGFQKKGSLNVYAGMPGDISSSVTAVDLGSKGYVSKGSVAVGSAVFLFDNGVQVGKNSTVTGATTMIAGFVARNQGLESWTWAETDTGHSLNIPDGSQLMVASIGEFLAVVTGVKADGTADHTPKVGENIWVAATSGNLASAPASVATVTGHYLHSKWKVERVGLLTNAAVATNQSFVQFGSNI